MLSRFGIPPICEREAYMEIGIHTPSWVSVVVSLFLVLFALLFFMVGQPVVGFWTAIVAYVVGALGVMVKT
jgi:hypothetical protein